MATCAMHGKNRVPDYLEEYAPGQFKCVSGYECKTGGAVGGGVGATQQLSYGVPMGGPMVGMGGMGMPMGGDQNAAVTCHLHGKSRKASVCTQVATQAGLMWECTPATRCKGAAVTPQARYSPYGRPQQAGMAGVQPQMAGLNYQNPGALAQLGAVLTQFAGHPGQVQGAGGDTCALHGKKRHLNFMQEMTPGVPGVYKCRADSLCKGAADGSGGPAMATGETAACSIHGRNRLVSYLQLDETTRMHSCKPGNECKMTTAPVAPATQ